MHFRLHYIKRGGEKQAKAGMSDKIPERSLGEGLTNLKKADIM